MDVGLIWLIDNKTWLTGLKDNQGMFSEILTMNSFIKAVCHLFTSSHTHTNM